MNKIFNPTQGLIAPLGYVSPSCNVIKISNEGVLCGSNGAMNAKFTDFDGEVESSEW